MNKELILKAAAIKEYNDLKMRLSVDHEVNRKRLEELEFALGIENEETPKDELKIFTFYKRQAEVVCDTYILQIPATDYERARELMEQADSNDWESGGNDGEVLGVEDETIWFKKENGDTDIIVDGDDYMKWK